MEVQNACMAAATISSVSGEILTATLCSTDLCSRISIVSLRIAKSSLFQEKRLGVSIRSTNPCVESGVSRPEARYAVTGCEGGRS